jgi:hypothetical protein
MGQSLSFTSTHTFTSNSLSVTLFVDYWLCGPGCRHTQRYRARISAGSIRLSLVGSLFVSFRTIEMAMQMMHLISP